MSGEAGLDGGSREGQTGAVRSRRPRPFLLGLADSVPDSARLDSRKLFDLAGHNTGNFAFTVAIRQQIRAWADPARVGLGVTPEALRSAGDICVIPGANKLGEHADMAGMADRLEAADVPTVVVSLGAQSSVDYRHPKLPAGTLRWLRAIVDHAPTDRPNVGVRGEFSRDVLAEYGFDNVCVLGCPSLFLHPSAVLGGMIERKARRTPSRVAVAAGGPRWRHLARIEQSLTRMVTATGGAYVCQAPLSMLALAHGDIDMLSPDEADTCRRYVDREMSMDDFHAWARRHAVAFYDVPAWIEFLRDFDFVVGTRIHGVMLGLQAGIPGLCVVSDSRTRELCETMAIPHVQARDHLGGLDRGDLMRTFQKTFDAKRFDANRRRLAGSYCEFLEGNLLVPSTELKQLAGDA